MAATKTIYLTGKTLEDAKKQARKYSNIAVSTGKLEAHNVKNNTYAFKKK